jgi:hypothetical protein
MYTDLLIEHTDFVQSCKCNDIGETLDISTNVTYNIADNTLAEDDSFTYKYVQSQKPMFCIDMFKDSSSDIMYYTGFPNHDIFKTTLNLLFEHGNNNINVRMNYNEGGSRPKQRMLSRDDEYFLVLIKLR